MALYTLVVSGSTNPRAINQAANLLRKNGYSVSVIPGPNDNLPLSPLDPEQSVRALIPWSTTRVYGPEALDAALNVLGVSTVESLAQVDFDQLISRSYTSNPDIMGRFTAYWLWNVRVDLLEVMVNHRLTCRNGVVPADILRTRITDLIDGSTPLELRRVYRALLLHNRIYWLELLTYLTQDELSKLERIGPTAVRVLKPLLEARNLSLRQA